MFNHIEQTQSHTVSNKEKYAARKLGLKNYWIFVAEDDITLSGTISLRKRAKTIGYVCDAVVSPKNRKQGIMKNLDLYLQKFAKENGMTRLILDVKTSNKLGVDTWNALDYQPYEIFMEKKI